MKLPFVLAKRFVAGESFDESIQKIQNLNSQNLKVTLDFLGENVKSKAKATGTVDAYIKLLHGIKEHSLISSISIKLTMIGLDIDREFCRNNLFRLLAEAEALDQFVRIDMEGSAYTQATIDIFKEAFRIYGKHVGIVLQCYLHRNKQDIEELAGMGADIRLVKGAYKEPENIALQNMPAIREAFKECAKILLSKTSYPRFATHDEELIAWVKEFTEEHSIPKNRYEIQMLYGLRADTMLELAQNGYNARIYVPYGTDWLPYYRRRLMERKENIWFVFSTLFKK